MGGNDGEGVGAAAEGGAGGIDGAGDAFGQGEGIGADHADARDDLEGEFADELGAAGAHRDIGDIDAFVVQLDLQAVGVGRGGGGDADADDAGVVVDADFQPGRWRAAAFAEQAKRGDEKALPAAAGDLQGVDGEVDRADSDGESRRFAGRVGARMAREVQTRRRDDVEGDHRRDRVKGAVFGDDGDEAALREDALERRLDAEQVVAFKNIDRGAVGKVVVKHAVAVRRHRPFDSVDIFGALVVAVEVVDIDDVLDVFEFYA